MNRIKWYLKTAEKRAAEFLDDERGRILGIAVAETMDQQTLDRSLSGIDIETLSGRDVLLLAYAMRKHSKLDFGLDNVPRLNGIIRYCRFSNLNQISCFSEVACTLNDSGIIPYVSYDVAMKYYLPENCRFFYDSGIMSVSHEQYDIISKVLCDAGYSVEDRDGCIEVLGKENQRIKKIRILQTTEISGTHIEIFHAQCHVPSTDDVIFIAMDCIWRKLRQGLEFQGMAFDIWDLYCMIKKYGLKQDALNKKLFENVRNFFKYRYIGKFVNRFL